MNWRTIKQIISVSVTTLMLVVSCAAVTALHQGTKFLSIQSGSMVPTFRKGDLVIVNPVPDKNYKVGDIINFINPNNAKQTVTHRVQRTLPDDGMQGKRVITKGDANAAADIAIPTSKIIGKVNYSIPYLGFVFDFVRQPVGLLLAIYTPALSIVIGEIKRLTRYYKDQEPYVATGFEPTKSKDSKKAPSQAKRLAKASSVATIAAVGIVVPAVQAALMSTATLTGTSITTASVAPPAVHTYPVISKLTFGSGSGSNVNAGNTTSLTVVNNNPQSATSGNASSSNGGNATSGNASNTSDTNINFNVSNGSSSSAALPTVTLYNPTDTAIDLSGWTLSDDTSTRSLPSGSSSVLASKGSIELSWPQANGLSRNGDRLILRSNSATVVDSLSWGADISQMNPSVPTTSSTISLVRSNSSSDTDTASDWQTVH
jgi:signal peptidase I